MAILTFDLGTTYYKVCLFDDDGQLLHVQRVSPPITHPKAGYWELAVEDFYASLQQAVFALRYAAGSLDDVRAISYATQANSFTLLDADNRPLTPLILWLDKRASDDQNPLNCLVQRDDFYATTGLCEIGGRFSPAKLNWLRINRPEVWADTAKVCYISDLLTLWLTGEHVTDCGMAGLSGLVDIQSANWWPEAIERCELPTAWLPRVQYPGTKIGCLRPNIAEELGLACECQMITGCLDQYAGAIGAANVIPGRVSETTGTVLATVRCADDLMTEVTNIYQGPAFMPGVYYQMVFNMTSAQILENYRNALSDKPNFVTLDREASVVAAGCEGLHFLEQVKKQVRFSGRTASHGRGHEVRAILEAVAYALKDQVDQLCHDHRPTAIASLGGAACSDLWLQIKADVLGLSFDAPASTEPTSLGAAMLAQSGMTNEPITDLTLRWASTRRQFTPNPSLQRQYADLLAR